MAETGPHRPTTGGRQWRSAHWMRYSLLRVVLMSMGLTCVAPIARADAEVLGCGARITTDTVLEADIGPCASVGIVIAADNVRLDLNGRRVFGSRATGDLMGVLLDNRRGVTVTNGTVSDFDGGVTISGGSRNTVSKMRISANVSSGGLGSGIALISSHDNRLEKNVVVENGPRDGISLDSASSHNTVTKNKISGNARDGLFAGVAVSGNMIDKNVVDANGRHGVHLLGPVLVLSFENRGPSVFDPVAPDRPAYVLSSDFAVLRGSGSGDVTAGLRAVDLAIPPGSTNTNPADTSTSGCEAADFIAAGFVAGEIALIQRGTCSFQTKVDNAVAAGAAAVVIFNEGQVGRTTAVFGALNAPAAIPLLQASYAVGQELSSLLNAGAVTVHVVTNTVSAMIVRTPGASGNTLAKNSGHGNAVFDGFDGTLDPPCDANQWTKNVFASVNQPCVLYRGLRRG